MDKITVRNALGDKITVYVGPFGGRWMWGIKHLTKNCHYCPFFIREKDTLQVIREVNINKGKKQWSPPAEEKVRGLCLWGVCPKVLVERERGPRKCEFFGKPSPKN